VECPQPQPREHGVEDSAPLRTLASEFESAKIVQSLRHLWEDTETGLINSGVAFMLWW
jgi:hypothetical protein